MKDKFLKLYDEVFSEDGSIKACGRAVCKDLILESKKLDSSCEYGNLLTGFMNIENIKRLHDSLMSV